MKKLIRSLVGALETFFLYLIQKLSLPSQLKKAGDFVRSNYETVSLLTGVHKKLLSIFLLIFVVTSLGILIKVNEMFTVHVPSHGGSLIEGVIGAPRFINPLLALSDADRDLTMLVYSGLLRATPEGDLENDLAESYRISEDGLEYTFTLKNDLVWHDGKQITSDDVVFTIERVKDSVLRSPKRASWEGVEIKKIDERTTIFTLKRPYSPFLENATLGILPKHIWEDIRGEQFGFSRYNVEPIGSGPYKVVSIKHDRGGIPKYYRLSSFKHFAHGEPYITNLEVYFYPNEEEILQAWGRRDVEAVNAIAFQNTAELASNNHVVLTYVLPRVFGVFFNQSQNTIFTSLALRKALSEATPREAIIDEVLLGYGTPLDGPLPPGSLGFTDTESSTDDASETQEDGNEHSSFEEAGRLLEEALWERDGETGIRTRKEERLSFSLSTGDTPELKKTAHMLKEAWEKLGALVEVEIWSVSDLNNNIIRPRNYDALLFGEIIGRESDPFAFWHSSQRNDPGLNIALYTNIATDNLLEKGRITSPKDERIEIYQKFQEEIKKDVPAVFVYSPDFIYIIPQKIQGVTAGTITVPSERFLDIHLWYTETQRLWKFFAEEDNII